MPDGDNPDEFAYSSDNSVVMRTNRAQRGETDGDIEMQDFGEATIVENMIMNNCHHLIW